MIRQYELVDRILKYNDKADVALLNRAYVFSMKAHGNQKRASGEPYLTHPLEVASILVDLKLDDATICTAILHDTVEDTLATLEEVERLFGKEIAYLVDGVTKLSRIEFNSKSLEQAENFRKLFMAMSKDIRVLLVKLADRSHNMRTIEFKKKEESRRRVAQETIDIYAPLADRIGLYGIKTDLEDRAFKVLQPEEYQRIESRMEAVRQQDDIIGNVVTELQSELKQHNIEAEVSGREKTIYSIHKKMVKKNLTFDQLTDIVAYRIVVPDIGKCYEVLGLIHNLYKAIPGRFKDYISNAKPNGYQSLHTSVIGPFGQRVEIQIRTQQMHDVAEMGVAAHWLYKAGDQRSVEGSNFDWVRKLIELLQSTDDPEEFLENTKMDLFKDEVFVFTPRGDLISLPLGATPLDFAYAIHSGVGNKTQAAKINGRIVPLKTQLQNGDQVEVITGKNQHPSPGWREIVTTAKARTAINRYLRSQELEEQIKLGREIVEKAAKRDSLEFKERELGRILKDVNATSVDDLFAAVAQGRLYPRQIFGALFPERGQEPEPNIEDLPTQTEAEIKPKVRDASDKHAVGIKGLMPGLAVHMAGCCNPLPGEPIVGIINTGKGVMIHAKNCKNLENLADEPDRWISVKWDNDQEQSGKYIARLRISLTHQAGALSSLSTAIFNADCNIVDLHIEQKYSDNYDIRCDVEVKDLSHFEQMVFGLKALSCVTKIERLAG